MNLFRQNPNLILATDEELSKLSQKESARVLVISDTHGRTQILREVLKSNPCDAFIFCGDGIFDITKIVALTETNEFIPYIFPPVVAFVQGNNDDSMIPVRNIFDKSPSAPYYIQWKIPLFQTVTVCGKKISFTHGHHYPIWEGTEALEEIAENTESDCICYGHTHIPDSYYAKSKSNKNILILNPGSLSLPRGSSKAGFAILYVKKDGDIKFEFKTV